MRQPLWLCECVPNFRRFCTCGKLAASRVLHYQKYGMPRLCKMLDGKPQISYITHYPDHARGDEWPKTRKTALRSLKSKNKQQQSCLFDMVKMSGLRVTNW